MSMQGDATVLLVTVGEPPEGLQAELERLQVRVVQSGFADAEESMDQESPDLIVLAGSRGAMELATLLDDQQGDNRPKMVIVAARKDLAKLRGLNREIVISLFALETTEKVVAQRVESLARRAARRRRPGTTAGEPMLQKTSLGLPTAVGKVNLKSAGPKPAAPPGLEPAPPSSASLGPSSASLGKGDLGFSSEDRESPQTTPPAEVAPPPVELPRVEPPRAVPARTSVDARSAKQPSANEPTNEHKAGDSEIESLVPDEDLVSLRPSEFDDEGEDTKVVPVVPIPSHDRVPRFDPEGDASGGGQRSVPPVSLDPSDPGELDISAAEQALENLDSVKLALTEDVKEAARAQLEQESDREGEHGLVPTHSLERDPIDEITDRQTPHVPLDAPEEGAGDGVRPEPGATQPGSKDSADEEPSASSEAVTAPAPPVQEISAGDSQDLSPEFAATALGHQQAPDFDRQREETVGEDASGAAAPPEEPEDKPEEQAAGEAAESLQEKELASPSTLDDGAQPTPRSRDASPDTMTPAGLRSPKKKGGGLAAIVLAAVALVGIGVAAASGAFQRKSVSAEAESEPAAKTITQGSATSDSTEGASAPPGVNIPTQQGPAGDDAAPGNDSAREGESDAASESGSAVKTSPEPQKNAQATQRSVDLNENPFAVEESDAPSCETLLGSNVPEPGGDPIHEASLAWNEARKMIVRGKVENAHKKMCEAVALNSESAAVEGLAGLYLHLGAPERALSWLERAEKLDPNQSELGNMRGDIYSQLGRTDEAREIWLKNLGIAKEDSQRIRAVSKDYSVEAGRYLRRGDLVRADLWFRRAVILDPENLAGMMGLAKTFYRAEKKDRARAFALQALEVSDVIPEVHVLLGEIAAEEGNNEEAKRRFERALEVRPDFFPAKRGLSQVAQQ